MNGINIEEIQKLVGKISANQLRYVECFTSPHLGIFIPVVGPCFYSITPEHTHPSYSFILTSDDNCQISIENKIIAGISGTLTAISPLIPHHEILSEEFSRYSAIMIDSRFFEEQLCYYSNDLPLFKANIYNPQDAVRQYIKEFILEYTTNLPGQKQLLQAMALKLTHAIIRTVLQITETPSKISTRMDIDRVIDYMHKHYSEEISIETLAESISLSKAHFSRIFKLETGASPLDFLIDIRLKYAKKLLAAEDISVTAIAFKCGFNSSSHFTTSFSKKFGINPTQFKKMLKSQKS